MVRVSNLLHRGKASEKVTSHGYERVLREPLNVSHATRPQLHVLRCEATPWRRRTCCKSEYEGELPQHPLRSIRFGDCLFNFCS
jgi:hypothetical protein